MVREIHAWKELGEDEHDETKGNQVFRPNELKDNRSPLLSVKKSFQRSPELHRFGEKQGMAAVRERHQPRLGNLLVEIENARIGKDLRFHSHHDGYWNGNLL
jgi:hypothetical protein